MPHPSPLLRHRTTCFSSLTGSAFQIAPHAWRSWATSLHCPPGTKLFLDCTSYYFNKLSLALAREESIGFVSFANKSCSHSALAKNLSTYVSKTLEQLLRISEVLLMRIGECKLSAAKTEDGMPSVEYAKVIRKFGIQVCVDLMQLRQGALDFCETLATEVHVTASASERAPGEVDASEEVRLSLCSTLIGHADIHHPDCQDPVECQFIHRLLSFQGQ